MQKSVYAYMPFSASFESLQASNVEAWHWPSCASGSIVESL